jgi:hypothetical protein
LTYYSLIKEYANRYPAIETLRKFYQSPQKFKPRLSVLEFQSHGNASTNRALEDAEALKAYWRASSTSDIGRLYILEDLSNAFVEAFGMHFKLDPAVFVAYLHTSNWSRQDDQPVVRPLPSARKFNSFYSLRYYEIIRFENKMPDKREHMIQTTANVRRDFPTAAMNGLLTGLIPRSCVFWYDPNRDGSGWDGKLYSSLLCQILIKFNNISISHCRSTRERESDPY